MKRRLVDKPCRLPEIDKMWGVSGVYKSVVKDQILSTAGWL